MIPRWLLALLVLALPALVLAIAVLFAAAALTAALGDAAGALALRWVAVGAVLLLVIDALALLLVLGLRALDEPSRADQAPGRRNSPP